MTADSSVIVAAVASWHERHDDAATALSRSSAVVSHAEIEAYSVLTRFPEPFRISAADAAEILAARLSGSRLVLGADARRRFVGALAAIGITGGAVYDGLIALTAREHDLALLTLDWRALATYQRLGAAAELI